MSAAVTAVIVKVTFREDEILTCQLKGQDEAKRQLEINCKSRLITRHTNCN